MNKPDFNTMTVDEARQLFVEIRADFIKYLSSHGFTQREIARRLGGTTQKSVNYSLQKQ